MLTKLLAKARIETKKCNFAPTPRVVNSVDRDKKF